MNYNIFYSFIIIYLSIRFNKIKFFLAKLLNISNYGYLNSLLLESEDWPLHRDPHECLLLPLKR